MSDLESAESLRDLQAEIEFDMEVLETAVIRCQEREMPHSAAHLTRSLDNLRRLRDALVRCGIWEAEAN